jgi:hypothetical protein
LERTSDGPQNRSSSLFERLIGDLLRRSVLVERDGKRIPPERSPVESEARLRRRTEQSRARQKESLK